LPKLGPLKIAIMVFLAIFLLSMAEIAVFGFTGGFTTFQNVIAYQLVISLILFFIANIIAIFNDL
jgi:hypothetical protein